MESCFDHSPDICNYVGAHCSTGEIIKYLSVATENYNAEFTGYLLQQLANREEPEVFVEELVKTVKKEIIIGSGFDSVVRSVLAMNCERLGLGPVLSNYEKCQRFPMRAEDLLKGTKFAECERFTSQDDEVEHDGRLDRFLNGFEGFGTAIIEIGYCYNSRVGDYRGVAIHEGRISHEDSEIILSFLDAVGINEDLPEFQGRWRENYRFEDSKWRSVAQTKGDETKWLWIKCLACTNT